MRVVHVYKDYDPVAGGIENTIRDLARAQAAAGTDVAVLVTDPGGQPRRSVEHGVRVLRVPRLATVASTPLPLGMHAALRALRPDLVHVHFPYPVAEQVAWLHGRRAPYVVTYHCDVIRQRRLLALYRPLLLRALRGAAAVMPTSARYAQTSAILADARVQTTVVPLGIDVNAYAPDRPLPRTPPASPHLLFVGVHRHYKGGDVLLRALAELPEARLTMVGDGPERPRWEALAADLGVARRVAFPGRLSDDELLVAYRSADAFVLPSTSRAEAFGLVLLEAMAAGLPAVSTDVGSATSELVVDGVTGAVARPDDPHSLAEAIRRVMGEEHADMRAAAVERSRNFTVDAMRRRIDDVYADVLG